MKQSEDVMSRAQKRFTHFSATFRLPTFSIAFFLPENILCVTLSIARFRCNSWAFYYSVCVL